MISSAEPYMVGGRAYQPTWNLSRLQVRIKKDSNLSQPRLFRLPPPLLLLRPWPNLPSPKIYSKCVLFVTTLA